jgi:HAE1 family hydrophobic/amphiphilic exporter-1
MLPSLLVRPTSVIVAAVAAVVLGVFSLLRLPVSLLPTLERPQLVILVEDAQRSRDELVQRMVEPLERRFAALRGVTTVRSEVDDGWARIVVESEWQTDADRLRIDAERRLSEIAGSGVERLSVATVTGDPEPVIEVAVLAVDRERGGDSGIAQRTRFVERTLIPELGRLPGAGEVRRVGGARLRVVVEPLGAALAARGLSASDVVARLEQVGRTRPVGAVRDGGLLRPLVVHARVSSLEELGALRLAGPGVQLREVARIGFAEDWDEGAYRLDGQDAVLVEVFRAPGANAVRLAREVRAAVGALRTQVDPGIELRVVADGSGEVLSALGELGFAALIGLLLGAVVLRWFLGSWRPTLALGVVVPASVCATFGAFLAWGVSLDVVSLAGLALALGMLVDNAIVVLESIESARVGGEEGTGEAPRVPARDPVIEGAAGVALALVASFLTTAAVFVPLLYLRGLARAFFGVQAFAIVSSLALSLALSLTLTPVLWGLLDRARPRARMGRQPGRATYLAVLRRVLARPWLAAVALLAASGAVLAGGLAWLPRELVPGGDSGAARIDFTLPRGLAPEAVRERSRALERAVPGASDLRYRARRPGDVAAETGAEGRLRVRSVAGESRGSAALDALERQAGAVAGVEVRAVAEPVLLARGFVEASGRWEIDVTAATRARAERLADRVRAALRENAGIDARVAGEGRARAAHRLDWKPMALASADAERALVEDAVAAALGGFAAGRMSSEALAHAEPEILVQATVAPDIGLLPVASGAGEPSFLLGALSAVELDQRAAPWRRRDGRPSITLTLSARGLRPARIEAALEPLALDHDERWRLSGAGFELERSFGQLRLALALAIVLVFLTVAALYESWTLPLAVMATVPVAAAGALLALALGGQSLNVMSFLGVILLVGIVVNNAIVLLHRLEQRGGAAVDRDGLLRATLDAAAIRYRPIVMTSLTTLLGMAPLALLSGDGAELRQALAIAVGGGMVAGTLASLVLVPALYVGLRGLGGRAVPERAVQR